MIELLVATMISAVIGMMLSMALFQTTKVQRTVGNISDISMRIALFQRYMERDVSGAFVPIRAVWQPKKSLQKEQPKGQEQAPLKEQPQQEQSQAKEKDAPFKPLEHVCLGTQKNGMLDVLTFITNNPISVFSSGPMGRLKPSVARVVYTLQPESTRKDSYVLLRQEGLELEFEKYKNVKDGVARPYELLRGIKSMQVLYVTYEQAKEGKELERKTVSEWKKQAKEEEKEVEKKEKKEQQKKQPVLLPAAMHVSVSLWDNEYVHDKTYEFEMPVAVFDLPKIDKEVTPGNSQSQSQQSVPGAAPAAAGPLALNMFDLGGLL